MGDYSQNEKIDNIEKILKQLVARQDSGSEQPLPDTDKLIEDISSKITEKFANKAISVYNKSSNVVDDISGKFDDFDNSKTLENLARSMSMQRVKAESNFESIGETKTSRKNEEEHQSTIDMLKDLD